MIKIKLNFNMKQQTEPLKHKRNTFAVNITLNENMITFLTFYILCFIISYFLGFKKLHQ